MTEVLSYNKMKKIILYIQENKVTQIKATKHFDVSPSYFSVKLCKYRKTILDGYRKNRDKGMSHDETLLCLDIDDIIFDYLETTHLNRKKKEDIAGITELSRFLEVNRLDLQVPKKRKLEKATPNIIVGESVDEIIVTTLRDLCIPTHIKGYEYLKLAIREVLIEPSRVFKVTELYDDIAETYNVRPDSVARSIRTIIERGLDIIYVNDIVEGSLAKTIIEYDNMTPIPLISLIAEHIRLNAGAYADKDFKYKIAQ